MALIALTLAGAVAGGHLARWLRVPGGMIVGAMVVTAALSLALDEVGVPAALRLGIFVGVGTMLGMLVTRDVLRALRPTVVPAITSGVLLICAGIGVALLMRPLGIAPPGDVLATSPGALSLLSAAAAEHDVGAPTVALFHITRIVLILLTLPLLIKLLPESPASADESGATNPEEPRREAAAAPAPLTDARKRTLRHVAAAAVGAAAAGLGALAVGIEGALIFGTTLGAALVTLAFRRPMPAPGWLLLFVQIGVGWLIGTMVTPDTLVALGAAILPAILSSVLVIAAGVGIAYLLRALGRAPPGDVLATSPGAVEALASAAYEHDAGAVQVAVFHTVRLVLVILSLPILLALLRG